MRVETVRPNGPAIWVVGMVGVPCGSGRSQPARKRKVERSQPGIKVLLARPASKAGQQRPQRFSLPTRLVQCVEEVVLGSGRAVLRPQVRRNEVSLRKCPGGEVEAGICPRNQGGSITYPSPEYSGYLVLFDQLADCREISTVDFAGALEEVV